MQSTPEPIAIVGMGGLFPSSPTLDDFWRHIVNREDTAREVPEGRWGADPEHFFDPEPGAADKLYSKRGCFLDEIPLDLSGLDIDAAWLEKLDPLFKLTLEVGRRAFDDARAETIDPERAGVILANLILPTETTAALSTQILGHGFEEKVLAEARAEDALQPTRPTIDPINCYMAGLPAGVLARALGLGGGSFTLDAACASSFYALALACDRLRSGRADAMLAGGVSRPDCLFTQMGFSQLRALSASGRASPFDASADGLVVGEGAGIFVLKRLADAERAGDRIRGVIRSAGLSNDTGGSLLAPDSEGQGRALRRAYERIGWKPSDVDLIECHATGTLIGDATEYQSLTNLWKGEGAKPGQCPIGSVKSNVGHLLTAAGAAGLAKVLLAIEHEVLPPSANFDRPAKGIDTEAGAFRVQTEAEQWERRSNGAPRRAGLDAFGFGGINAHLLIEEYTEGSRIAGGVAGADLSENDSPASSVGSGDRPAEVAIVGMEARFGRLDSLRRFQEAALSGTTDNGSAGKGRWFGVEKTGWFKQLYAEAEPWRGSYLGDLKIRLDRYRIPPAELREMLGQQLLMLDVAAAAAEDARLDDEHRDRTGVFIGIGLDMNSTNFHLRWSLANRAEEFAEALGVDLEETDVPMWLQALRDCAGPPLTANRTTGALGGMVASRIARELRVGGPSFTLSAEENSGIRALETAVHMLQSGELDRALVGAVDLSGDIRSLIAADVTRPFSSVDSARPFDRSADGAVPGEGAVAFVLKRLDEAVKDGDRVYAVVRGLAIRGSGDGHHGAATPETYRSALECAYDEARVDPFDVSLIETHGSGVPDEDRVEAQGLTDFYDAALKARPDERDALLSPERSRAIGALKAQIGAAGAASGLASVARAALALYHETLPPFPGLDEPIAELARGAELFHAPRAAQHWLRNRAEGPRLAGVSSIARDGTCAHVVLAGVDQPMRSSKRGRAPKLAARIELERRQPLGAHAEALFIIEEDKPAAVINALEDLGRWVEEVGPDAHIEALARRWHAEHKRRPKRELAAAIVARDCAELLDLTAKTRRMIEEDPTRALDGSMPVGGRVFYNPRPLGRDGEVGYVFPGSGNQYIGMGVEAAARWPDAMRTLDADNEFAKSQFNYHSTAPWRLDWRPEFDSEAALRFHVDHQSLITAHVSYGCLISDIVRGFGVEPKAVLGYSLGETAGYFALGVWRARDEMMRRVRTSSLFKSDLIGACTAARGAWGLADGEDVDWCVGVINRPAAEVKQAVKALDRVYLLIINTPSECVIGGRRENVLEFVESLGCDFRELGDISTVHCEIALQVQDAYRGLHLFKTTPPPGVRFYSVGYGRLYEVGRQSAADAIVAQAIGGFDFPRIINKAYEDGVRIFLEMGPRASCSRMVGEILGDRPHVARSACAEGQSDVSTILRMLGKLVAERAHVDLNSLYGAPTLVTEHRALEAADEASAPMLGVKLAGEFADIPDPQSLAEAEAARIEAERIAVELARRPAEEPRAEEVVRSPAESGRSVISLVAAELTSGLVETQQATADAHDAFLRLSQASSESQVKTIGLQMDLLGQAPPGALSQPELFGNGDAPEAPIDAVAPPPPTPSPADSSAVPTYFSRDACLEFARGSITGVLGSRFVTIDSHPTRVRLPDEPLMLVDRIVEIEGEPISLGAGRLVTEHDVLAGGWYIDQGRMPPGVAIESGQADLFLAAYLGIDFETRGEAVYRLLDASVSFHRGLPRPGEIIRFDIKIDRFIRQGETYLFFFNFEGSIDGKPLMTMRDGCAGFFTPKQLAEGRGVAPADDAPPALSPFGLEDWPAPMPEVPQAFDELRLDALRRGDLPGCFGDAFSRIDPTVNSTFLPEEKLALIHRVTELDPRGGRFGMGRARSEIEIHPDDWFLTCHFVDDPVMPGTLMYDSCLQTLRVFLMRMGWVGVGEAQSFEPRPGVEARLKCRGQVLRATALASYEIDIKEIGYGPEPYAIADALMYADGRPIVQVFDMSLQLTGATRESIKRLWGPAVAPSEALYTREQILHYCYGKPSIAFGERFSRFDDGRFLARLPSPPYLFVDRITAVQGEPWILKGGTRARGEYDVPADAWYFRANRQPIMPYSVILEIPLQGCGWLAAYCGAALESEGAMKFRNLGGTGTLHEPIRADAGTLTFDVELLDVSRSGGMIILNFTITLLSGGRVVFDGKTVFGFFPEVALANQVGLTDARLHAPSADELAQGKSLTFESAAPLAPDDPNTDRETGLALPSSAYRMLDSIALYVPNGGPNRLGFIRGTKRVESDDWFFKAHFFQDPVTPGSLGLESFLQLLKVVAIDRWGAAIGRTHIFEPMAIGAPHEWVYRGQVVRKNRQVVVEAVIDSIDDTSHVIIGSGYLRVDDLVIYEMKRFAIRAVPIANVAASTQKTGVQTGP